VVRDSVTHGYGDVQPAEGRPFRIESFRGIDQVIDEVKLPKEFTPWARGGYFSESNEFTRIPGKKLLDPLSSGGHILTLQQMSFQDGTEAVLVHRGANYSYVEDVSELSEGKEPETPPPPTDPMFL
jgi:hypothetical protein